MRPPVEPMLAKLADEPYELERIFSSGSTVSFCQRTTATESQPIGFRALMKPLMNFLSTSGPRIAASSPLSAKKSLASSTR